MQHSGAITLFLNLWRITCQNEVELGNDFKLATPKRIYYVFDGWYLNENYTGERVEVTDKNIEV